MADNNGMLPYFNRRYNRELHFQLDPHQARNWLELLGGGLIWPGPPWVCGPCDRCGMVDGPFYEARSVCLKWRGIGTGVCDFNTSLCKRCRDLHEQEVDQDYLYYCQRRSLAARWN